MIEKSLLVVNNLGVHARPIAQICQILVRSKSSVTFNKDDLEIRNEPGGADFIGIGMLALGYGTRVMVKVEGPDEETVMKNLEDLFSSGFGELTF